MARQVPVVGIPFPVLVNDQNTTQIPVYDTLVDLNGQINGSVSLTGQSITGNIGTVTPEIDKSLTGVAGTSGVGTLAPECDLSLTGVAATSGIGTPLVEADGSVTLTGVQSVSACGSLIPEIDLSLTGVASTSAIGTLSTEVDASVTLTGVEATSELGDLELQIDTNPAISGVASTASVGTLHSEIDISVDGVEATSDVGMLIATLLALPGVFATVELGTISVTSENGVVVGVQSIPVVGQPLVVITPNFTNIPLTGISSTAHVGSLTRTTGIHPTGVAATGQVGTISAAIHNGGLMLTDVECLVQSTSSDDIAVTLRWSNDDGNTWSDSAIRSIGATGAYLTSPQWRRLGMARRQRVFEISWSCPKATALAGATIRFEDAAT